MAKKAIPAKKSAPVKKAPVAKKSPKADKSPAAKTPKKATAAPVAAKKAGTAQPKAQTTVSKAAKSGKSTSVPVQKTQVIDDEKDYVHALTSLKKSKNKPSRKVRLYRAVKSLLGVEKVDDVRVERIVQRLINNGHLAIDANGSVTKTP